MIKRKCPFGKVKCPECVLYRKGLKYFEVPGPDGRARKPEPFEECAIIVGLDCLENMVDRLIGNQKAMEQTRNNLDKLIGLFTGLIQARLIQDKENKRQGD